MRTRFKVILQVAHDTVREALSCVDLDTRGSHIEAVGEDEEDPWVSLLCGRASTT